MIKFAIRKVKSGEETQLRAWMAQLNPRRSEIQATFKQEGVRHEQAYLLQTSDGPILVYAMEAADHDHAARHLSRVISDSVRTGNPGRFTVNGFELCGTSL